MIHSLRRAHRWMMLALVVLLPAVFVAGMLARPRYLAVPRLPEEPAQTSVTPKFEVLSETGLKVHFGRAARAAERAVMTVIPLDEPVEPDLLVYWDERPGNDGKPSDTAILLGTLKGRQPRAMTIPQTVPESSGFLVLYSLAHAKVLGASQWHIVVSPGGGQ